jgi:hypothetical protein
MMSNPNAVAKSRRGDRVGGALPRSAADLGDVTDRRRLRQQAMKNDIEKLVVFYRGYLIDDRSLVPLTIAFATFVALWLFVYLASAVGPQAKLPVAQASTPVSGPVSP